MFWIVVVVIVLIVVAAISSAATKTEEAQKRQEFNVQAESRVSAYADYLKRTKATPAIADMTENEIRDFLQTHIRQYAAEAKGITTVCGFIVAAGFIFGFFAAASGEGFGPFLGVVVVTLCIAGGLHSNRTKALDQKYRQMGLDPDKLKVES